MYVYRDDFLRIFARVLLLTLLCALLLAGAAVAYLSHVLDASTVQSEIETRVSALTGGICRIEGGLDISLYPRLAVRLDDLVLAEADSGQEVVRIDEMHVAVRLLPLLSRSVEFERVMLVSPSVVLRTAQDGSMPWRAMLDNILRAQKGTGAQQQERSGEQGNATQPERSASMQQEPLEQPGLKEPSDQEEQVETVQTRFSLTGISVQGGMIEWRDERDADSATADSAPRSAPSAGTIDAPVHFTRLSRLEAALDLREDDPWHASFVLDSNMVPGSLVVSAKGTAHQAAESMLPETVQAAVQVQGALRVDDRSIPVTLHTDATLQVDEQRIDISKLQADVDGTQLSATLQLTDSMSQDWELAGRAQVDTLSLPYWFAFGEHLPESLQHALDSIKGTLDLRMNRTGLQVDSLAVEVLGMRLQGKGAVADFSRPVIYIDVAGDYLDVNAIFPEIMVEPPKVLPHPSRPGKAVLQADMEPDDNPDDDIEYDIRVRAAKAKARNFTFEGLSFRCWPMPKTGTYNSYTIDSFYGGTVDALLGIRDTMTLDVSVGAVRVDDVSRLIVGNPVLGGTLSATASVQSDASTVWGMVAGLQGTIKAQLEQGHFRSVALRDGTQPEHPIDSLSLVLQGKSLHKNPDEAERYLPYQWDLRMAVDPAGDAGKFDVTLNGPVVLDARRGLPVRTNKAAASMRWQGNAAPLGSMVPVDVRIAGDLDLDLEKEILSLANARFKAPAVSALGALNATDLLGSPVWTGSVSLPETDLRPLLARYGYTVWDTADPRTFSGLSGTTAFRASGGVVSLEQLNAQLDRSRITGSISGNPNGQPGVRFSLQADFVDFDRYLPPQSDNTNSSAEPWNLQWLTQYAVSGDLAVDRGIYRNLECTNLQSTVQAGGGHLAVGPFTTTFYKGTVNGTLTGTVRANPAGPGSGQSNLLETALAVTLAGVDLEAPATRLAGGDYIGGTARGHVSLKGMLGSWDDVPRALDGVWGFKIDDGYYSLGARTDGTRNRSSFGSASANGRMDKGVLRNDDLTVSSLLVSMTGGGYVDLARKNMDYQVNVTYAEIPTFPVRIYGPLNDPKTAIRGAEVLPRTIGKIGGGLFNIFKRVITTPFKALEMLGNIGRHNATQ